MEPEAVQTPPTNTLGLTTSQLRSVLDQIDMYDVGEIEILNRNGQDYIIIRIWDPSMILTIPVNLGRIMLSTWEV